MTINATLVQAFAMDPPRLGNTFAERWEGPDQGLVCCWLRGREKARESPALADEAMAGHLPILPWKGGVEKKIKGKSKLGSLLYLAMWQGLRGEDLWIDTSDEVILKCRKTGVTVTFTSNDPRLSAEE